MPPPSHELQPPPQLLEEVEALLGRPFSSQASDYEISDYTAPELGLARFIYQAARRTLAEARHKDRVAARQAGDYDPQAFNQHWQITTKKVGEISCKYHDRIQPLVSHLTLVQNAERYVDRHWQELTPRLNKDQQAYVLDIVASLCRAPRIVRYTDFRGETDFYPIHGTTVIAPTGFGKTRLIEALAKIFYNAGQLEQKDSQRTETNRTLVVCPSRIIQRQNAEALTEQLPNASIGLLNGEEKNFTSDIVVSTIASTRTCLADGRIGDHPIGVLLIDEGHHLTEPGFEQAFVQKWRGPSVVLTATPAYNLGNDVRRILPHIVERTTLLDCIEKKTLSAAEVYTLVVTEADYQELLERYGASYETSRDDQFDQLRAILDSLVIEAITPWLEEGRRGMIFCEPGNQSYNAAWIANRLSTLRLPNGKSVVAESIDSYQDNQERVLKNYETDKVDVITSVAMGREGMNADFDFVVLNRNLASTLWGSQMVGRGTRKSSLFATTKYLQIVNLVKNHKGDKLYSVEQAFGNTNILQGGKAHARRFDQTPIQARPEDFPQFPDLVAKMLARVDYAPLGQTFVGANRAPRARDSSYIRLPDMLRGYLASESYAKKLLLRERFPWQGKMETVDGILTLVRSYPPEAQVYLHSVLPKGRALQIAEVAKHLGVTASKIKSIARDPANGIHPKEHASGPGRPKKIYDDDHLEAFAHILAKEKASSPPAPPKPPPASKQKDINIASLPIATEDEKYLSTLAADIGIDWQVVKRNLTDKEWASGTVKQYAVRKRGRTGSTIHWSAEDAAAIANRMQKFIARPLPAHIIPKKPLCVLVRVGKGVVAMSEVESLLQDHGFSFEEMLIVDTRSFSNCTSWAAVELLAQTYGRGNSSIAKNIDYRLLPKSAEDRDPERIAYAQYVQRHFIPHSRLQKY